MRSNVPSHNVSPSADAAVEAGATELSRREFLPRAATAVALLFLAGCSGEATTPATADKIDRIKHELPRTAEVIAELAKRNGTLTLPEYQSYFVQLANALNADLTQSYGAKGLSQYQNFNDIKIAPTVDAALEHGLIIGYYPTQSASTGRYSIDTYIKAIGDTPVSFVATPSSSSTIPKVDLSAVLIRTFDTVLMTSGAVMPVGTMVRHNNTDYVLVDEAQVRTNARTAGVSEDALVRDVVLNEIGHFVMAAHYGLTEQAFDRRSEKIHLAGESNPRPFIQFEEAFSDFYTLSLGQGTIAYHVLTYPARTSVEQYALTNEIFLRGLQAAIAAHQDVFARSGMSGNIDIAQLASLLHHNPLIRPLQESFRRQIASEYEKFFSANLADVGRQIR